MAVALKAATPSLRSRVSDSEWQARVDLAAAYRLLAHFKWTDGTATHISAAVPDEHGAFLINPHGMLFHEVTASSLVKIDLDGNVLLDTGWPVNKAGFVIHSAIHKGREDISCVIHTHTRAGIAVSAMKCGMLMISQHALRFYNRVGYHDFAGIACDLEERETLVRDLGPHKALILRNHGLIGCGTSMAEAFSVIMYLERICESQIAAMSGGAELTYPSPEICERTAKQYDTELIPERGWTAHKRMLDQMDPSYAT